MFWADELIKQIKKNYQQKIEAGTSLIIRDEKTLSGRVHIGSLRGVAIHGIISQLLSEQRIKNKFLYEMNDFDPMDDIPVYLDRRQYEPFLGKPLCEVPAPDGSQKSYAEYFGAEFIEVIKQVSFCPEFYWSAQVYKAGKYNEVIKIALESAKQIRLIYKRVANSTKAEDWLPVQVICERCGKIGTTKAVAFDGELVTYRCLPDLVSWAKGCSYYGRVSPFDGRAKLPWKVEWAAKFKIFNVHIEGGGKDHSTRGGSRDVANAIAREVFKFSPPFDIPYEFFIVGGKKMSASKGVGASSKEIAELMPPEILRMLMLETSYKKTIDFDPKGETLPKLFDLYDNLQSASLAKTNSDAKRVFTAIHLSLGEENLPVYRPRFTQLAYLLQMPHINIEEEVARMKGEELTAEEKRELAKRLKYVKLWLEKFAPDKYIFQVQETIPPQALKLTKDQKKGLAEILKYIKEKDKLDGQELHSKLHEIKKELNLDPRKFFAAIYLAFLGKTEGPKAGWFLSVLNRDFLIKRLEEVIK